jgi:hypothetical protein
MSARRRDAAGTPMTSPRHTVEFIGVPAASRTNTGLRTLPESKDTPTKSQRIRHWPRFNLTLSVRWSFDDHIQCDTERFPRRGGLLG